MPTIADEVAALTAPTVARLRPRSAPLWEGPEKGGITQSLLSRFLQCRERFRLFVVGGLAVRPAFDHRLEFGNMWHAAEEGHARGLDPANRKEPLWRRYLDKCAAELARRYPFDREKVQHWRRLVQLQFPLYLAHWAKHPDEAGRTPLLQEEVFAVPYRLPSGRAVTLRGKWDGADLIRSGKAASVWLLEHKTKGDVYEPRMVRQLSFDNQTMIYLTALDMEWKSSSEWYGLDTRKVGIAGVRYNVVRRPLSGGKYTVTRHKGRPAKILKSGKPGKVVPEETPDEFYRRVEGLIRGDPEHFFMRWNVTVTPADVARFRRETLDPVLEQLWDWWEWVCPGGKPVKDPFAGQESWKSYNKIHWRHPFGVRKTLDEGGATELDAYLATGDMTGLTRVDDLFPELADERSE